MPVLFLIGIVLLLDPLFPLGQAGTRSGELLQMVRPYAILPVLGMLTLVTAGIFSWRRLCWRINHAPRFREDHCPHCDGTELRRTRRKPLDRRAGKMGLHVRRYICRDCRWHGLRVQGLLVED